MPATTKRNKKNKNHRTKTIESDRKKGQKMTKEKLSWKSYKNCIEGSLISSVMLELQDLIYK